MLFIHLVLPASLNSLHPRHRLKKALSIWWRNTTRAFRLSSLIYGLEPEKSSRYEAIWPILDRVLQIAFGKYNAEETQARVPNVDQVLLLPPAERKNGGVFVPLQDGRPKSEADMIRMLKQNRLARNGGRDERKDYTVVWLPKYWRTRIHVFIFCALVTSGAVIGLAFFTPLVIGRMALGKVFGQVHDGYSLVRLRN